MVDQVTEQTEAELKTLASQDGVTDAVPVEDDNLTGMLGETDDDVSTETETETETEVEGQTTAETVEESSEVTEEPKTVPLAALHEEREKHRTLRDDPEALARRLSELKAEAPTTTPEQTAQPEPAKVPEYGQTDPNDPDPDTLISDEDLDGMLPSEIRIHQNKCNAWKDRENNRVQNIHTEMGNQRIDLDGRRRFTATSMGEGLDYDSVLKTGSLHLSRDDLTYINRSPDKAKTVYDLCVKRCPALKFMQERSGKPSANNPPPNSPSVQQQTQSNSQEVNKPPDSITDVVENARKLDANDRNSTQVVDSLDI